MNPDDQGTGQGADIDGPGDWLTQETQDGDQL
jgi:hypothetical protein